MKKHSPPGGLSREEKYGGEYICTSCGHVGESQRSTKGSFLIEIILWLFFLIPGLIYTIWRLSSKSDICPKCGNATMIPLDTPKGKELVKSLKIKPIKEEKGSENTPQKKKSRITPLGFIVIVFIALAGIGLISSAIKEDGSLETTQIQVENLPVRELVKKTESQIKADYANEIKNYDSSGLTPSKKVEITNFDVADFNIQIDYDVATSKPVYIGFSFSDSPKQESVAWQTTGFQKPSSEPNRNLGITQRRVEHWENIKEVEPFRLVQIIYNKDGTVGKISFAMEDLATAQGTKSLYYVP